MRRFGRQCCGESQVGVKIVQLNRTAAPHNARADPSTGAADPGGSGTGDGSALVDPRALGKRVTPGAKCSYPRAYSRVRGQGHAEQCLEASVDPGKPQVQEMVETVLTPPHSHSFE